jgi:hypothetical protein
MQAREARAGRVRQPLRLARAPLAPQRRLRRALRDLHVARVHHGVADHAHLARYLFQRLAGDLQDRGREEARDAVVGQRAGQAVMQKVPVQALEAGAEAGDHVAIARGTRGSDGHAALSPSYGLIRRRQ